MSTQSPNPYLVGRSNVTMAVAQPKPRTSKAVAATGAANANAKKNSVQMHRRSRTGSSLAAVIFPFPSLVPQPHTDRLQRMLHMQITKEEV